MNPLGDKGFVAARKMSNNFLHFALKILVKTKSICLCTVTSHHSRVRYPVLCLEGTLASQISFHEGIAVGDS